MIDEKNLSEKDLDEKIMSIEHDKRERIITAAMAEFTKGYKQASTDVIAHEAGISKGLLFHYFGTKKNLFLFLCRYSINILTSKYLNQVDLKERDILKRVEQSLRLKYDMMRKYPSMINFMNTAHITSNQEYFKKEYVDIIISLEKKIALDFLKDIDVSLFRDDIDVLKTIDIIIWSLKGYSESKMNVHYTTEDYQAIYEQLLDGLRQYFNIFRKVFYK